MNINDAIEMNINDAEMNDISTMDWFHGAEAIAIAKAHGSDWWSDAFDAFASFDAFSAALEASAWAWPGNVFGASFSQMKKEDGGYAGWMAQMEVWMRSMDAHL